MITPSRDEATKYNTFWEGKGRLTRSDLQLVRRGVAGHAVHERVW